MTIQRKLYVDERPLMTAHEGIEWLMKHDFVPYTILQSDKGPAPWGKYIHTDLSILVHYNPSRATGIWRDKRVWIVRLWGKGPLESAAANIEDAMRDHLASGIQHMLNYSDEWERQDLVDFRDSIDCLKDIEIPEICEKKQKTSSTGARKNTASKSE